MSKQECIGHVQTRVGTALRKLKKETPGLEGKGKLTDAIIDKLQNYYGIAIRSNVGNMEGMKQAVLASLFHCASNESRKLHDYSPVGPYSWCGYQRDRAIYKHGPGLPLAAIAKGKPVYQRLSEDGLLQKCLHGKTQNRNESLNGMAKMCWNLASLMLFPISIWVHKLFYSCMMHFKFLQGSTLKMDVNSWMQNVLTRQCTKTKNIIRSEERY